MASAAAIVPPPTDSPEARRYNRIRRWIGVADFVLSLILMVALLATGWSGTLRDIAYKATFQHYSLAVFLYVLILMVMAKVLGLGLDYYSFRLEHRYQLSNLRLRAWIWDETKGFLVGVILAGIVAELLYFIMRQAPQHWWLIAWAAFLGLFVLLAQLAPVVLFPIFYKFAPLENEELKERLVRLGARAGTRVRGVYQWKLSEKSKKANAALTGLGTTRRIILADTLLANYSTTKSRPCWLTNSAIMCTVISSRASWCKLESRSSDSGLPIGFCTTPWIGCTCLRHFPILPICRY
jgi:STE24 endopeptidase